MRINTYIILNHPISPISVKMNAKKVTLLYSNLKYVNLVLINHLISKKMLLNAKIVQIKLNVIKTLFLLISNNKAILIYKKLKLYIY